MRVLPVVVFIVWFLPSQQLAVPIVMPLLSDGVGAGFVVEMQNTTGAELTVVKGRGRCRFRVDGKDEDRSGGGSSGGSQIAAGGKWQEVVKFVAARSGTSSPRQTDALWPSVAAWRDAVVQLAPGRHTVSFQCGGAWSADVPFYWNTSARSDN